MFISFPCFKKKLKKNLSFLTFFQVKDIQSVQSLVALLWNPAFTVPLLWLLSSNQTCVMITNKYHGIFFLGYYTSLLIYPVLQVIRKWTQLFWIVFMDFFKLFFSYQTVCDGQFVFFWISCNGSFFFLKKEWFRRA